MSMFKPSTSRRREVRKTIPRHRAHWREVLSRRVVVWGLMLALVFWCVASLIVTSGQDEPAYQPSQLVDKAQLAQVAFDSVDVEGTETAQRDAERGAPPVFTPNESFQDQLKQALLTLPEKVAVAQTVQDVPDALRTGFGLNESAVEAFELLKSYERNGKPSEAWVALVDRFMTEVQFVTVLSDAQYQQMQKGLSDAALLQIGPDLPVRVPRAELINIKNTAAVRKAVEARRALPAPIRSLVATYIVHEQLPLYSRNEQLTRKQQIAAHDSEKTRQISYLPGQILVPAGKVLTPNGYRLLKEHLQHLPPAAQLSRRAGLWGLVGLATLVGSLAILGLRPRIVQNPMRGLAFIGLQLSTLAIAWAIRPLIPGGDAAAAIGAAMLSAVILAIAYDRMFAAAIVAIHALLIALALNLGAPMYLAVMTGCIAAIAQLGEVRHRGTLIRVCFTAAIVVAAGVYSAEMAAREHVEGIYRMAAIESGLAAGATLFVGFFALGILPFIERAFRVTTSMTLLELGDMNQPLLRKLAQSAPGTFNHSLQVASLAEHAAEAIGASGLLARVGAYYHDIGKMHKPAYFVENQAGGVNPHEKVSPAMSLLIVVGHVKNGVEMAREYNLPSAIIHFIEAHHGTTLAEYFYHAAAKNKTEDEKPAEFEYRYPGPKPTTREAAIVMICDCIESACRAMGEPTAARIEQLVHTLATKRLLDGQFDHCDLTLGELHLIEQAITKSLCAIYHGRISYPTESRPASRSDADKKPKERTAI